MGIDLANSIVEHKLVLSEALDLYVERNNKYQDLWKKYGARDNLLHLRSKYLRVREALANELPAEAVVEDAMDLINYAVFLIRNVRDGNLGSEDDIT